MFASLARAPREKRGPVSLRFVPDPSLSAPRIAFAVGKDVGGAVRRNRARRRLRAAIAAHAGSLVSGSYLFGGNATVATCPFATLDARVAELIESAGARV
jgi:ribonuclease P protein component